jgi:hypothetical protein
MSVHVLDLHDSDVRIARGTEVKDASPGYALIDGDALVLGEPAAAQARIRPRQTYTRFWSRLNQNPLSLNTHAARHHADLAYAHLKQLHAAAGAPDEVIIAAPGPYTREQLALLLGLVAAVPMRTAGLVDAAVAALAPIAGPGRYAHVEIGLHEAVVTHLEAGDAIARREVDVVDACGLDAIHDACAAHAADQFIGQNRFDPFHQGRSEQLLYDALARWLGALASAAEVDAVIEFQGPRRARLTRTTLLGVLEPFYARIRARIAALETCVVSHRAGALPGLSAALGASLVLDGDAVLQGCLRHQARLRPVTAEVSFATRLPVASAPTLQARGALRAGVDEVTHVLHGHRAYAIGLAPLYLHASGEISALPPAGGACSIARHGGRPLLRIEPGVTATLNGAPATGVVSVGAGDRAELGAASAGFLFISVAGVHGT